MCSFNLIMTCTVMYEYYIVSVVDKGVNTVLEAIPVWPMVPYILHTGQYRCTVSGLPLFNIYIICIYFKHK